MRLDPIPLAGARGGRVRNRWLAGRRLIPSPKSPSPVLVQRFPWSEERVTGRAQGRFTTGLAPGDRGREGLDGAAGRLRGDGNGGNGHGTGRAVVAVVLPRLCVVAIFAGHLYSGFACRIAVAGGERMRTRCPRSAAEGLCHTQWRRCHEDDQQQDQQAMGQRRHGVVDNGKRGGSNDSSWRDASGNGPVGL
jgi:hypothetical protein